MILLYYIFANKHIINKQINKTNKQPKKKEKTRDAFKLIPQLKKINILQWQVLVCEIYIKKLCSKFVAFENNKEKMTSTSKAFVQNLKTMQHATKKTRQWWTKHFELIQRLQQLIETHKGKNKMIFQNTLDTNLCINVFMTQLVTSKCNQSTLRTFIDIWKIVAMWQPQQTLSSNFWFWTLNNNFKLKSIFFTCQLVLNKHWSFMKQYLVNSISSTMKSCTFSKYLK